MKLIAISFGISTSARETIENIGKNIFNQPIFIIDLKISEPEVGPIDNILIFGAKANRLFSRGTQQNILILPELKELEPGNDKSREQTYANLLNFKQQIQNQKIISEDSLPNLSCNKILALENRLKEKNENSWKGKTKDGRSVEIQLESINSDADIILTFSELYAIKAAMDVLDIEGLIIK